MEIIQSRSLGSAVKATTLLGKWVEETTKV